MMIEETMGGRFPGQRLARGLGVFGIGIGVAQIVAPKRVARLIGLEPSLVERGDMIAIGLREITVGLGLLLRPRPAFAWLRVVGDLMDLAFLGRCLSTENADRSRIVGAAAAVVGVGVLDAMAAQMLTQGATGARLASAKAPELGRSITIQRPADEVYRLWRNFENLARFMDHVESVEVIDSTRSHWVVRTPLAVKVEWDAEIVEDRPGELISWHSVEDSRVQHEGSVEFKPAPGGRGTEVCVDLRFASPLGRADSVVASVLGEQVRADLRRFKQFVEIGEVTKSDASIHRSPHPARPAGQVTRGAAGKRRRGLFARRTRDERAAPSTYKEVER